MRKLYRLTGDKLYNIHHYFLYLPAGAVVLTATVDLDDCLVIHTILAEDDVAAASSPRTFLALPEWSVDIPDDAESIYKYIVTLTTSTRDAYHIFEQYHREL